MTCVHGRDMGFLCTQCAKDRDYLSVPRQIAALIEVGLTIRHPGMTDEEWRQERGRNLAQAICGNYDVRRIPDEQFNDHRIR